jgi:hypothetical protein
MGYSYEKKLSKDPNYFDSIIFSDECILKTQECGYTYVKGPRSHKFSDRYIRQKKNMILKSKLWLGQPLARLAKGK